MQTARRLVKGPDTAETSKRHLAYIHMHINLYINTYTDIHTQICSNADASAVL